MSRAEAVSRAEAAPRIDNAPRAEATPRIEATSRIEAPSPMPPTLQPAFTLKNVSLWYQNSVQALREVSLTIQQGERICILGANGSGKSTLALLLAGLVAPDSGDVELLGHKVCTNGIVDFAQYEAAKQALGIVFQNPDDQIVTTVCADDVAFGPENQGLTPAEISQRVTQELDRVALLDYAARNPTTLSGGQKQRLALAGALALHPKALILDEPSALLDARGRRSIMHLIGKLKAQGITTVHITHFMEEALFADRVMVLDAGRIVFDGSARQLFASQSELLMSLHLEIPFIAQLSYDLARAGLPLTQTTSQDELIDELVKLGPQAAHTAHHAADVNTSCSHYDTCAQPPNSPAEPLDIPVEQGAAPYLRVQDVSFHYTQDAYSKALNDLSFCLNAHESLAIIGQTGSGKSTLVRLLCGLALPDAGTITLDGIDLTQKHATRKLLGKVGYVMQHPERQLFAKTVLQDVSFGPLQMGFSAQEAARAATAALTQVGLGGKEDLSPFELSGGQQRLAAIAGILAMNPQVLVMDEPTAGLDPKGREDLHELLAALQNQGTTLIYVTHDLEYAAQAHKVLVLNNAHELYFGTPREVFTLEHEDILTRAGLALPYPAYLAKKLTSTLAAVSFDELPLTYEALLKGLVAAFGSKALGSKASAPKNTHLSQRAPQTGGR